MPDADASGAALACAWAPKLPRLPRRVPVALTSACVGSGPPAVGNPVERPRPHAAAAHRPTRIGRGLPLPLSGSFFGVHTGEREVTRSPAPASNVPKSKVRVALRAKLGHMCAYYSSPPSVNRERSRSVATAASTFGRFRVWPLRPPPPGVRAACGLLRTKKSCFVVDGWWLQHLTPHVAFEVAVPLRARRAYS